MFQLNTKSKHISIVYKSFLLVVICFIVLHFSSCKSAEKSIVGSWKNGGDGTLYDQYNILTFDEDGTGICEIIIPKNQDSEEIKIVSDIKYKIQDDTLYIDYISEDGFVNSTEQTFAIDNDTLTLNSQKVKNAKFERVKK